MKVLNGKSEKDFSILNNPFIIALLIMPFFKPASLEFIAPDVDSIIDIWRILSLAASLVLYIYNRKISRAILAIVIYEVILFVSTFINNGDYWKMMVSGGTVVLFSMIVELCVKNNFKLFLNCVFFIYFFLISINFILVLLFPNGLARDDYYGNKYNFLAIDNSLSPIFVPLMVVICLFSTLKSKKITFSSFILLLIISATTLITWSATGVVGWFIMLMYILFVYKTRRTAFLNVKLLYFVFVVLEVCFVFLRIQDFFAFIIEGILGKNLTFTGRTIIWDGALELIKNSPILGYGVYEGHGLILYYDHYMYAHNGVLEILLQGGIVGLIAYIAIFVITGRTLYEYRSHYVAGIITAGIFSMLIMMLMESFTTSIWLYGLLIFASCVPEIISQLDNETSNNERPLVKSIHNKNISISR